MIRNMLFLVVMSFLLLGCINQNNTNSTNTVITANQQKLLDEGWNSNKGSKSRDISSEYGITPIYGIQDNYFDVKMGAGSDLVLKIIDLSKNKCIRYIYVQENSEYTISQVPQGKYKLLIAYGKNWMTLQKDGETFGKFADNVHYEQSIDVFDFGKKNSKDMVNYLLTINVHETIHATNFNTEEIREDQFYSIK